MNKDSKTFFYDIISQYWTEQQVDFIRKQYDSSDKNSDFSEEELDNLFNRRIARFFLSNKSYDNFRLNAQDVILYRKYSKKCMEYELKKDANLFKIWDDLLDMVNGLSDDISILVDKSSIILNSIVNAVYVP